MTWKDPSGPFQSLEPTGGRHAPLTLIKGVIMRVIALDAQTLCCVSLATNANPD
jgi:hypothetical protein